MMVSAIVTIAVVLCEARISMKTVVTIIATNVNKFRIARLRIVGLRFESKSNVNRRRYKHETINIIPSVIKHIPTGNMTKCFCTTNTIPTITFRRPIQISKTKVTATQVILHIVRRILPAPGCGAIFRFERQYKIK